MPNHRHFNSLSSFLEYLELPPAEHPMFSLYTAQGDDFLPCPKASSEPISNDCYSISYKKFVSGDLNYGRTKYDFNHGALFFIGPRQVLHWDNSAVFEQKGFSINFHEDFLNGTELATKIKQYGFFSYSVNEALHLSPKEESQIELLVENMHLEYHNNPDSFSRDIILAHLGTLLKYAERFYHRQFENRQTVSTDLLERFNQYLELYYTGNEITENGVPKIEQIADNLLVSKRYLSDTLKRETGKSSSEHLQNFLILKAKNMLLKPNTNISDVAYSLGFEYPPYFSRLFKKKEGISPGEFRAKYRSN